MAQQLVPTISSVDPRLPNRVRPTCSKMTGSNGIGGDIAKMEESTGVYICDECGHIAITKDSLKAHINTQHMMINRYLLQNRIS